MQLIYVSFLISGTNVPFQHQLCFAHGLHLAVCDFLYKSLPFSSVETVNNDEDTTDEDRDCEETFDVLPEDNAPREITDEFELGATITKVRASVLKFKNSPVRCDEILERHLPKDANNKTYSLILDVKTRWSSTFAMLERFEKVQEGLQRALFEMKLDVYFPPAELKVISKLTKLLKCVSVTLSAICGRKMTLINVDSRITSLLSKINDGTEMGAALADKIAARINERRTVASSAMQFVFNGQENNVHCLLTDFDPPLIYAFLKLLFLRLNKDVDEPLNDIDCRSRHPRRFK